MRKLSRAAKRRRIEALIQHYQPLLNLSDWTLRVEFYNRREDFDSLDESVIAACEALPEYKEAKLTFTLDEMPEDLLGPTVVHELTHCILWPMTHFTDRWAGQDQEREETARYVLESVTTHLDSILYRTLPKLEFANDAPKVRASTTGSPVRGQDSEGREAK